MSYFRTQESDDEENYLDMDSINSLVNVIYEDYKLSETEISKNTITKLVKRFKKDGKDDTDIKLLAQIFRQFYLDHFCSQDDTGYSSNKVIDKLYLKKINKKIEIFFQSENIEKEKQSSGFQKKTLSNINTSDKDKDDIKSKTHFLSSESIKQLQNKFWKDYEQILADWEKFFKRRESKANGLSKDLHDFLGMIIAIIDHEKLNCLIAILY